VRFNLGCGPDIRPGYVNVDFRRVHPVVYRCDLLKLPWPWENGCAEEVLMLDFLEHVPYVKTRPLLHETNRILSKGGGVVIQVPDFALCARIVIGEEFLCNDCECTVVEGCRCQKCGKLVGGVKELAMHRLYGGQNYEGNWHNNSFTPELLREELLVCGFGDFKMLEEHHQRVNWNFKIAAVKL
jgi:hypothetical protein